MNYSSSNVYYLISFCIASLNLSRIYFFILSRCSIRIVYASLLRFRLVSNYISYLFYYIIYIYVLNLILKNHISDHQIFYCILECFFVGLCCGGMGRDFIRWWYVGNWDGYCGNGNDQIEFIWELFRLYKWCIILRIL